jgi:hypothetical protein
MATALYHGVTSQIAVLFSEFFGTKHFASPFSCERGHDHVPAYFYVF